jgi:heme-degrading monooxygenase HmoA
MTPQNRSDSPETKAGSGLIYRVDKFVVPDDARDEFMDRVRGIHAFLRTLPGFVQDSLLEQTGGPGEFNIVTIAVWDGAESFENAREAAAARYRETGFDPQETIARLGIRADLATYKQIGA